MELTLQEKEQAFFKLFHSSSNMVVVTRISDGRIIDVNERLADFLGYRREELIGQNTYALDVWEDPGSRKEMLRALREAGRLTGFESRVRARTGGVLKILFSIDMINLGRKPCLYCRDL